MIETEIISEARSCVFLCSSSNVYEIGSGNRITLYYLCVSTVHVTMDWWRWTQSAQLKTWVPLPQGGEGLVVEVELAVRSSSSATTATTSTSSTSPTRRPVASLLPVVPPAARRSVSLSLLPRPRLSAAFLLPRAPR